MAGALVHPLRVLVQLVDLDSTPRELGLVCAHSSDGFCGLDRLLSLPERLAQIISTKMNKWKDSARLSTIIYFLSGCVCLALMTHTAPGRP